MMECWQVRNPFLSDYPFRARPMHALPHVLLSFFELSESKFSEPDVCTHFSSISLRFRSVFELRDLVAVSQIT